MPQEKTLVMSARVSITLREAVLRRLSTSSNTDKSVNKLIQVLLQKYAEGKILVNLQG
jgi:hypothetical protein